MKFNNHIEFASETVAIWIDEVAVIFLTPYFSINFFADA